ncbi:hypothetical protein [Ferruginibacter sp.]
MFVARNKISALGMLVVVSAPLLFFAFFLVRQKMIEHDMEEELENSSLQTVVVNHCDVVWLKKNKEVSINGKLFDVRTFTVTGNKITFTGLFDNEEDALREQLRDFIHQKNNSGPLAQLFTSFMFPPLYNQAATSLCYNTWELVPGKIFPYQEHIIFNKYSSLVGPPPKYA